MQRKNNNRRKNNYPKRNNNPRNTVQRRNNNQRKTIQTRNNVQNDNYRKKNSDGKIVLILVIALVAFALGAAIGINVSLQGIDSFSDNQTHEVDVTGQMTSHPNGQYTHDLSGEDVNFTDYNNPGGYVEYASM